MIEERAVILSLEQGFAPADSVATLEIERKTACGLCGQTRGCGNSLWGKLFSHKSATFKADNVINAQVGQHVIVGIDEQSLLKSAFLLYVLPLVSMLLVSILAMQINNTNMAAMLGAVLGLLLGLIWVKGHTTSTHYLGIQQPQILRLACDTAPVKFN